jgi:hypothetical protein
MFTENGWNIPKASIVALLLVRRIAVFLLKIRGGKLGFG